VAERVEPHVSDHVKYSVAVIFEIRSRLSTDFASSRTTVFRCLTS
jgi:hypothetical protein